MDALIGIAVILGGFAVMYLIANIVGSDGEDPNNVSPDSEKPLRRVVAAIRHTWLNLLRKRGLWRRMAVIAAVVAALILTVGALTPKRLWISGSTIVTLSRNGTLKVYAVWPWTLSAWNRVKNIKENGWSVRCVFGGCNEPTIKNGEMEDYIYDDDGPPWRRDSSSITDLVIKKGVILIGSKAFSGLSELTSVTIPGSVDIIWHWAFANCRKLSSVTIPNGVTVMGGWVFEGCENLASVIVSGCVGDVAFVGCTGLTSITIEEGVTKIGHGAFRGCTGLTSVTIPNSVTTIEDYAFDSCGALTTVTLGKSVTNIGFAVFKDCNSLTSITILNPVPPFHWAMFGFGMSMRDDDWSYTFPPPSACCLFVPPKSINQYRAAFVDFDCFNGIDERVKPIDTMSDS